MQFTNFIGIDISKKTLDFSLTREGNEVSHIVIENTEKSFKKELVKWLKEHGVIIEKTLFCMEHTGIYNNPILAWLEKQNTYVWVQSAIEIKKSVGLTRGKNDKVDAKRISMYAYTNQYKLRLWQPSKSILKSLTQCAKTRSRLIKARKQLQAPLKEMKGLFCKDIIKKQEKLLKPTLESITKQIKKAENEMLELINSDEELKNIYGICISVPGVGLITAIEVITKTQIFTLITDAKKLACYSGVVPFEYTSGTSLRSKARVSPLADKNLKSLLHLGAISAIKNDAEMKAYYERKLLEGKSKMLIINNVRNKIVHRIFACVKQNRKYIKNMNLAIA